MSGSFMENFAMKPVALTSNDDIYNGSPTSDVYNMKHYDEITFIIAECVGGDGAATVTVLACDDTTPSNTSAVAFDYAIITSATTTGMFSGFTAATTSGITTGANGTQLMAVRVHSSALPAGYPYIQLKLTETESTAVIGFVAAILGKPSYAGDSMPDPSV